MTVRIYRSTDGSAPTLSGTVGDLTNLLDKILADGYGSKTALGWAKEFTGTNKRVYRPASGNRFRLRVDDTGTTQARTIGYESMTDVDTGTGGFPTNAQVSGGLYWGKSTVASATTRDWIAIGTGTFFILFVNSASQAAWTTAIAMCFGDFVSYKSGDAFNTLIIGSTAADSTTNNVSTLSATAAAQTGMYVARSYTQSGGSLNCGKHAANNFMNAATVMCAASSTYPDAISNGLLLSRLWVSEGNALARRGYIPGVWTHCHTLASGPAHGDTWTGSGDFAGKTFEMVRFAAASGACIETSNTW